MNIIGISAYFHDSAAALLSHGCIVAAAEEERFSRKKHDASYPARAIEYVLSALPPGEKVDAVVYYEKPFLKFDRLLETYLDFAPKGFQSFKESFPLWMKEKIFLKQNLKKELKKSLGYSTELFFSEHHLSHAASCFYASPFEEAAVLCLDGVGEWATSSLWHGKGAELTLLKEINFPHSLGLFYSTVTAYLGFRPNSDEYKVMGLAPYGNPIYVELMKEKLIDIKDDGSFRLNLDHYAFCTELKMYQPTFEKILGRAARIEPEKLETFHADVAASLQKVTEEIILKLSKTVVEMTGQHKLCLAGGVALNCVANGQLLKESFIEDLWIQPAAGDSGGALGAALAVFHQHFKQPRKLDLQQGSLFGPSYSAEEIENYLKENKIVYEHFSDLDDLAERVAVLLDQQKVGAVFQGRMEYGPRALGSRSIIADARNREGQKHLNAKIKYREDFRPFAPIVLEEDVGKYFELNVPSPYMLLVSMIHESQKCEVKEQAHGLERLHQIRSKIPAVTHVDYSARIQTVSKERHPNFERILRAFKKLTGESVLVNTSFNVKGEPIVCHYTEALHCFYQTELDFLMLENCLVVKERL